MEQDHGGSVRVISLLDPWEAVSCGNEIFIQDRVLLNKKITNRLHLGQGEFPWAEHKVNQITKPFFYIYTV